MVVFFFNFTLLSYKLLSSNVSVKAFTLTVVQWPQYLHRISCQCICDLDK